MNRSTQKVVQTISGHSKKITNVKFHPSEDILFSTSADKTAKVWRKAAAGLFNLFIRSLKGYEAAFTVKVHSADVVGCSIQATGDYWATASLDKTWAIHDLNNNVLAHHPTDSGTTKVEMYLICVVIHSVQFHPDGLLLGTGTDSVLKIWDIKTFKNAANFEGHKGKILDIAFSENG